MISMSAKIFSMIFLFAELFGIWRYKTLCKFEQNF